MSNPIQALIDCADEAFVGWEPASGKELWEAAQVLPELLAKLSAGVAHAFGNTEDRMIDASVLDQAGTVSHGLLVDSESAGQLVDLFREAYEFWLEEQ